MTDEARDAAAAAARRPEIDGAALDSPALDPAAPPLPGRAVIRQRWSDFLFLHWRVPASEVASMLPAGTRPDVFDGSAWLGLIPFVLSDHAFLPLPPVPGLGTFIEINVRTYSIDENGERGVVFRSLDAEQLPSVLAAQALFGLPYRWAQAGLRHDEARGTVEYRARRRTGGRPRTRILARPGTTSVDTGLSRFLTARWGFHERHLGRTIHARNSHEPWPLVEAELLALDDELLAAAGFPDLARRPPDSVLATPVGHPGLITEFAAARPLRPARTLRPGDAQRAGQRPPVD
ncbi:YqjF family protein [Microcella flavibacter]|uniref:YqjF family protein n=1 Tax=Microcella flavibacter TaxID=1804990 RepID=UPI0014574A26|nr:DUF2071 domain-containing protein [Microcella flavibacter]